MTETEYKSKYFKGTARAIMVGFIRELYQQSPEIAEIMAQIVHDQFEKLPSILKDAEEGAEEDREESPEKSIEELIKDQIETYFVMYDLEEEGDGIYTWGERGDTYKFGTNDDMQKAAEAEEATRLEEGLDSSEPSAQLIKDVIESWTRGETKAEYIARTTDMDVLAVQDGHVHECHIGGTVWDYVKV